MIVKLLTEHRLEFLSLKGGCTGSSESTHVKIPHCWKSHVLVHFIFTNSSDVDEQEMPHFGAFDVVLVFTICHNTQGSHRLEKYLNIQDCLEKSFKIKFALKST